MIRDCLKTVISGNDLTREQAQAVMNSIMSGDCTDAQIGAFITAMRIKGESIEEITGFVQAMRDKATRIKTTGEVIDTCGTGGDASGTFNISTAAALVAAGAGARVAKHGNRSVSSSSGSADVLRELGLNLEAETGIVERCISEAGIGFLFAPRLHAAMKHAIGPRREIGIRTVFNILGPLTNPAGARRQLLGVYASRLVPVMAQVLRNLGSVRAMVVHGHDGLDEITIAGETTVAELKNGEVNEYVIAPEDFGMKRSSLAVISAQSPEQSAAIIRSVLTAEPGPARDITVLNAAAALVVSGVAEDMITGTDLAAEAIDSGRAMHTLERLVTLSAS